MPKIDEKTLENIQSEVRDQKLSKKHQLLLKESKSFQKLQTKQLRPK